jgi:hypothetical protein
MPVLVLVLGSKLPVPTMPVGKPMLTPVPVGEEVVVLR